MDRIFPNGKLMPLCEFSLGKAPRACPTPHRNGLLVTDLLAGDGPYDSTIVQGVDLTLDAVMGRATHQKAFIRHARLVAEITNEEDRETYGRDT